MVDDLTSEHGHTVEPFPGHFPFDFFAWSSWFWRNRTQLDYTILGTGEHTIKISTEFIGIDQVPSSGDGQPKLYRTTVEGGFYSGKVWWWTGHVAAANGHRTVTEMARGGSGDRGGCRGK